MAGKSPIFVEVTLGIHLAFISKVDYSPGLIFLPYSVIRISLLIIDDGINLMTYLVQSIKIKLVQHLFLKFLN